MRTAPMSEEPSASLVSKKPAALSRFYRYYDMRLCQSVYLAAMMDYQAQGGKSRGSAIYSEDSSDGSLEITEDGTPKEVRSSSQITVPELVTFSLDGPDGREHQEVVQEMKVDAGTGTCKAFWRGRHKLEDIPESEAFEVVWKAYREKKIY